MEQKEVKRRRAKVGRLTTPLQVAAEQARLYRMSRWNQITLEEYSRWTAGLAQVRQSLEVGDVQLQIEELKDLLNQPAPSSNVILLKGRDPK